jgi:SAM-dependent methyltransferase
MQPTDQAPEEFWEEFYGGEHPWTGKVNPLLAQELTSRPLAPGRALDLGCGTGADATWLASQGWDATGVDVAEAALVRARAAAEQAGAEVTWLRRNLDREFPEGPWDLVTASYLHSPAALGRDGVLRRAVESLAPGGTLIVVSHAVTPSWKEHAHDDLPTLTDVVASLEGPDVHVVHAEAYELEAVSPEGVPGTKVDTVVRVQRR